VAGWGVSTGGAATWSTSLSQEQLVETWTGRHRTPNRFSADLDTYTNTASGTTDPLA
jgi:hypothetical protein